MKKLQSQIINIIGFPMDLGADRRGVDMGPSALRIAGIKEKLERLGYRVQDSGDLFIQIMEKQKIQNPKMKYFNEIFRTSKMLAVKVEKVLEKGQFPVCVGGDHSMAIGSIAGISSYCRKKRLKLGIIWIDAHADMNTEDTTPSGNIHGMPLAVSMGKGNEKLIQVGGFSPKVDPQNVALIGIRSIDPYEKLIIKELKPAVYTMSDIDRFGIHKIISKVLKQLKEKVDHIHVSFDLDSVDPSVAPGVGTPIPGGLSFRETHLLMEAIAESRRISSLEVTEVNPILDNHNKSAEFAAEVIASIMGQKIL